MTPICSKMTVVAALLALLLAACDASRNLAQYQDMPESARPGRLNATDDVDSGRAGWLQETRPAWSR